MTAILFGSIGTIADTSEIQRRSYNEAFAAHGLDWDWDRQAYIAMLDRNGGVERIEGYAAARGEVVDAQAVHQTKSERFQQTLVETPPPLREGVADVIRQARAARTPVGLVTTTSAENVRAVLGLLGSGVSEVMSVVVDRRHVDRPKPDPQAYAVALEQLGVDATSCLAIEDNPGGIAAAVGAGVPCVAFPNANTATLDFDGAVQRVTALDYDDLMALGRQR
jgi:HAD superfamily hydrolase (TIGR01509 family)